MARPLRVLIVEDCLQDAELLLRELRRAGFEPEWIRVENEDAYLANLHAGWHIILSDYNLPQFDGFRALELLQESGLNIPFILISGTIGEDSAVNAMKKGAHDYLLKDRLARLGPAIEHALEENRLHKERAMAREALALRERALGEVSQGVLICNENRLVIYANPSFTHITGYEQSEILGQSCAMLQGPLTDPATIRRMRIALEAKLPFEGEILNYRKDGSTFWNEISLTPIRDNHHGPVKFIGTQRDITERKLASETLQKSEATLRRERAQLRALIDSIPDLIFFKDTNSVFLGCNVAFERYLHVTEAEIIGHTDFDINRETAEFYRSRDHEMLASGQPQTTEEWIYDRNGNGSLFETVKTPFYGVDERSLGIVAVSRNITERKRSEEERRTALERLQIATQAAQLGIWEFDVIANRATWDEQMFAIYGLPANTDKQGTDRWFHLMEEEDILRCQQVIEEAMHQSRNLFDLEFRIRRADTGAKRIIRSMGTIKRDAEGHFVRMVGVNHDVTEERERERELALALAQEKELSERARAGEQAKGDFLAAMSHELRTPLNGILGFAELLEQSPNMPEESRQYSKTITQSGEALLRILDDILDFSQLEAGRLRIETTKFDPRKLVYGVRDLLVRQAQEKDVGFDAIIEESVPELLIGDPGRIRQILVNLIGNAIKFTDRGSVRFHLSSVRSHGDGPTQFAFEVHDTGHGIPSEKLETIFQPFIQADSSISRRYGGTGLGLSITRRLTELLGGEVTVSSTPGEGSVFRAVLPLSVPERSGGFETIAHFEPLDSHFAQENPLRIMVVEDDKINLKLIQALIRRLGYDPLTAHNGREAVEIYRREKPNCILMDLQMPEMDGIEATMMIRSFEQEAHSDASYIFALTANILPADKQRCFEAGMNEHLNKPVKIHALAQLLTKAYHFQIKAPQSGAPVISKATTR